VDRAHAGDVLGGAESRRPRRTAGVSRRPALKRNDSADAHARAMYPFTSMVEVKGFNLVIRGMFGVGFLFNVVGVATLAIQWSRIGVGILVVGLSMFITAIHAFRTQRYQLCATEQGVSFAGSAPVAWSEIDQIFVGQTLPGRSDLVVITFRRKWAVFRLPATHWISYFHSIGDVDVVLDNTSEPSLIVAQLEALRVQALRIQAVGTFDGVIAGTSELPSAGVIERNRKERTMSTSGRGPTAGRCGGRRRSGSRSSC
jgi:hypothetical protein